MKTVTYQSVLKKAAELTGRPFSKLTVEESESFLPHIESALRDIWEKYPWPETIAVEKFYFATYPENDVDVEYPADTALFNPYDGEFYKTIKAISYGQIPITDASGAVVEAGWYVKCSDIDSAENYDNTLSYEPGSVVYFQENGRYYAVGSSPTTAGYGPTSILSEFWGEVTKFTRDIDKLEDELGVTRTSEIGEVYRITKEDPRATTNLTPVNFYLIGDTIRIIDKLPYVWLEYRTVPPSLSTEPATIPYRFSEYVSRQAASMMLLVDGKADLGMAMAAKADEALTNECDKVACQEGQTKRVSVGVR